ncbi:hypothetical protein DM02DRAFT_623847 [Periconia macrospinosa]|uniref:Uncharacterized protein n=1 Tax=Periconia macrospinosa TaxID=97972 RepID=A0A2V1E806_9PLEO|nr:hypothetical protein DM02DRAFT_623847 [Periconia macrospinosa]
MLSFFGFGRKAKLDPEFDPEFDPELDPELDPDKLRALKADEILEQRIAKYVLFDEDDLVSYLDPVDRYIDALNNQCPDDYLVTLRVDADEFMDLSEAERDAFVERDRDAYAQSRANERQKLQEKLFKPEELDKVIRLLKERDEYWDIKKAEQLALSHNGASGVVDRDAVRDRRKARDIRQEKEKLSRWRDVDKLLKKRNREARMKQARQKREELDQIKRQLPFLELWHQETESRKIFEEAAEAYKAWSKAEDEKRAARKKAAAEEKLRQQKADQEALEKAREWGKRMREYRARQKAAAEEKEKKAAQEHRDMLRKAEKEAWRQIREEEAEAQRIYDAGNGREFTRNVGMLLPEGHTEMEFEVPYYKPTVGPPRIIYDDDEVSPFDQAVMDARTRIYRENEKREADERRAQYEAKLRRAGNE